MSGRMDFEFGFASPHARRESAPTPGTPARILILGNFSGRRSGEAVPEPISQRRLHALDIDTFDSVLSRLKPRIHLDDLGSGGAGFNFAIDELDDFHPDALFRRLDVFRSLRDLRRRLLDPATFPAAAAELGPQPTAEDPAAEIDADRDDDASAPGEGDADTLERLLGRKPSADAGSHARRETLHTGGADLTSFIRDLVAPHVVPEADARQEVYVDSLDAAIRTQMRAVLHHPAFQAVEASWRGLDWLLRELELGEELQLFVCDVTKSELLGDLMSAADHLETSELYRLVVEQEIGTRGGRAWSLLLGDYHFGHSEDDVSLLSALGAVASQAGAPLLAGADAELLGSPSLAESPDPEAWTVDDPIARSRWDHLRNSLQSKWLGLVLPRVIMRLPYGPQTDPIESFPFEELTADPDHAAFAWGNGAFACALLLARTLLASDGSGQTDAPNIEGLPAYTFDGHDGKRLMPCAEVLLSDRAGREILERGFMPLLSHRNRNAVSIMRFQSLSDPPTPLGG